MKPMPSDSSVSSAEIEKAASAWLARCDVGLSEPEELEFETWLSTNPRHAAAWAEIESTWRVFDEPRQSGAADSMVRELAARQHRRRWRRSMTVAAGLAAAAAVVVLLVRPSSPVGPSREKSPLSEATATVIAPQPAAVMSTDAGRGIVSRTEHRVLEDGSVVELDRGAEIEVNFRPTRRSVRLVRGEALFTVTKNTSRPFVVSSGRVDVQAVGTAFAVKAGDESVDVIVTEGRVAVGRTNPNPDVAPVSALEKVPVLVAAGGRLVVPSVATAGEHLQVETLAVDEMDRRLAWLGPRLELAATRLSDAVALFNRESRVQLRIADAHVGEMRLSGAFRADDAEGFARLLEANYGVESARHGNVIELSHR